MPHLLPLTSDDITTLIRGIQAAGTESGAGVTTTMTALTSTLRALWPVCDPRAMDGAALSLVGAYAASPFTQH